MQTPSQPKLRMPLKPPALPLPFGLLGATLLEALCSSDGPPARQFIAPSCIWRMLGFLQRRLSVPAASDTSKRN